MDRESSNYDRDQDMAEQNEGDRDDYYSRDETDRGDTSGLSYGEGREEDGFAERIDQDDDTPSASRDKSSDSFDETESNEGSDRRETFGERVDSGRETDRGLTERIREKMDELSNDRDSDRG